MTINGLSWFQNKNDDDKQVFKNCVIMFSDMIEKCPKGGKCRCCMQLPHGHVVFLWGGKGKWIGGWPNFFIWVGGGEDFDWG